MRTHLTIMAPLMRATFAGAAALMFILLANEFAASLLVRAPTPEVMGTVLYDYYGNGLYPQVAAIALVMVAVTGSAACCVAMAARRLRHLQEAVMQRAARQGGGRHRRRERDRLRAVRGVRGRGHADRAWPTSTRRGSTPRPSDSPRTRRRGARGSDRRHEAGTRWPRSRRGPSTASAPCTCCATTPASSSRA